MENNVCALCRRNGENKHKNDELECIEVARVFLDREKMFVI